MARRWRGDGAVMVQSFLSLSLSVAYLSHIDLWILPRRSLSTHLRCCWLCCPRLLHHVVLLLLLSYRRLRELSMLRMLREVRML